MAAVVFTSTTNETTAAQTLAAGSSTMHVSGDLKGGRFKVEVSDNGTDWATRLFNFGTDVRAYLTKQLVIDCRIPIGWQARLVQDRVPAGQASTLRVAFE